MSIQKTVAGALIDFMGYLTTRKNEIRVGASSEVYPLHELFQKWASKRGLDYENPDMNWANNLDMQYIEAVSSKPGSPVIKILWGDGVETYAHFGEKSELVHIMGKNCPIPRRGVASPEEVKP